MKRPSFQFYPDDWTGNSKLRRCTHEEKGIWMDVLCVLHDQDEYGIARWPLKELADAVGTTLAKLRKLISKGVLKGADAGEQCESHIYVPRSGRKNGPAVELVAAQEGPIWFSSRMVEDEHKRMVRGSSDHSPDYSPKGGIGDGLGAASKGAPNHSPSHAGASPAAPSSPSPSPTNPSVEPDGSTGADAPGDPGGDLLRRAADDPPDAPGLTAVEALFQVGVPWLVERGMRESNARSLLGGARKQLGEEAAWDLMSKCINEGILEPGAWISKTLNEQIASGKGSRPANRPGRSEWNERMAATKARAEGGGFPREKDMGVIDATSNQD